MSDHVIEAENLGPIASYLHDFQGRYGIHVVVGRNGVGKSILLDGVKTAARGSGKVPLRDHTKRGRLSVCGSTVTIGGTCRHTGEIEVDHIEGKFDIGTLIDPQLKSPAAADAARIKALVALTGATADPTLFQSHAAFTDWEQVVEPESLQTDDLVEMARRIKANYDQAARKCESDADKAEGHASGMAIPEGLDLDGTSDEQLLRSMYDASRDALTALTERQRQYEESSLKADGARARLEKLQSPDAESPETISKRYEDKLEERNAQDLKISELESQLQKAQSQRVLLSNEVESLRKNYQDAVALRESAVATREIIDQFEQLSAVDAAELEDARCAVAAASRNMEQGTLIRQARKTAEEAAGYRKQAAELRERSARLRDAGRSTDEVLSSAIRCDRLRVESDGKSARLVVDTDRGSSTPFHELSAGQRGTLAVEIAADVVGAGGLVTIDQETYEGIDSWNRLEIHRKAVERALYVFTVEAAKDSSLEQEFVKDTLGAAG